MWAMRRQPSSALFLQRRITLTDDHLSPVGKIKCCPGIVVFQDIDNGALQGTQEVIESAFRRQDRPVSAPVPVTQKALHAVFPGDIDVNNGNIRIVPQTLIQKFQGIIGGGAFAAGSRDFGKPEAGNDRQCSRHGTFGSPYSRLIASIEITHCFPNLQTSTPSISFP